MFIDNHYISNNKKYSSHSDENKTIFDWCKEGAVKGMEKLLKTGEKPNINSKDDQVNAMWWHYINCQYI